eukprot:TRINITY_DN65137_c0_g1_i1.p1 TRINITY_DN65137_c0_g1~~TRINITY_DN65137_c0_g1_i1.p1  ORF type:complete len:471 (+),score=107.05 TRINITY_DN65137_c0_g1_i1:93-1505(+)
MAAASLQRWLAHTGQPACLSSDVCGVAASTAVEASGAVAMLPIGHRLRMQRPCIVGLLQCADPPTTSSSSTRARRQPVAFAGENLLLKKMFVPESQQPQPAEASQDEQPPADDANGVASPAGTDTQAARASAKKPPPPPKPKAPPLEEGSEEAAERDDAAFEKTLAEQEGLAKVGKPREAETLQALRETLSEAQQLQRQEHESPPAVKSVGVVIRQTSPAALGRSTHQLADALADLRSATSRYASPDKMATMTSDDVPATLGPIDDAMKRVKEHLGHVHRQLETISEDSQALTSEGPLAQGREEIARKEQELEAGLAGAEAEAEAENPPVTKEEEAEIKVAEEAQESPPNAEDSAKATEAEAAAAAGTKAAASRTKPLQQQQQPAVEQPPADEVPSPAPDNRPWPKKLFAPRQQQATAGGHAHPVNTASVPATLLAFAASASGLSEESIGGRKCEVQRACAGRRCYLDFL